MKYCTNRDKCQYSDCPTAFCDLNMPACEGSPQTTRIGKMLEGSMIDFIVQERDELQARIIQKDLMLAKLIEENNQLKAYKSAVCRVL